MTAREMFEELGYELVNRYDDRISYERNTPEGVDAIDFPLVQGKYPTFACFYNGTYSYVFVRELKAIQKQCEELGWL